MSLFFLCVNLEDKSKREGDKHIWNDLMFK